MQAYSTNLPFLFLCKIIHCLIAEVVDSNIMVNYLETRIRHHQHESSLLHNRRNHHLIKRPEMW
jgi:hypothetical protein